MFVKEFEVCSSLSKEEGYAISTFTCIFIVPSKKTTFRTPVDMMEVICFSLCCNKHTVFSTNRNEEFISYK